MIKLGFLAVATAVLATPCIAASREYEACLFLAKKVMTAPDTFEVIDFTDFTAISKPVIVIKGKSKDSNLSEFRTTIECTFNKSGSNPVNLVSFAIDNNKWSGPNADLYRDYLKIGGF
ncbi:hypothetical protein V5F77_20485 [Xanthobacter sp. DSM 24535]|uniref:hypothetical protein n=1 Tax=Roseixanthobacter psychrophilus TaxID=3119917 RepID=UPI00372C8BED